MADILSFLHAIAVHPDDDTHRLVFADWLEEQGDWRAEFLRLDCLLATLPEDAENRADLQARWLELRAELPHPWRIVLGRSAIENCGVRFRFNCPRQWTSLEPTEVAAVRFCDSCSRKVYYCGTIEQAREHARQGDCVALDVSIPRSTDDLADPEESWVFECEDGMVFGELESEEVSDELEIEFEEE